MAAVTASLAALFCLHTAGATAAINAGRLVVRAKTHVLPISGLGVIEMTRKRVRESLGRRLTDPCPYCEGRGRIRSRITICHEIFREISRQRNKQGQVMVAANPEIAAMLAEDQSDLLSKVEAHIGRSVVVEARSDFHHEAYRVYLRIS